MKRVIPGSFLLMALALCSCAENPDKTTIGAASGGALGAGLGAIIGSQTGSAGGGMVIGAATGAAAGALIGNSLDASDKRMAASDESLKRNDETIRTQRSELDQLKRMNSQDTTAARGSYDFQPQGSSYGSSSSRGGDRLREIESLGQGVRRAGPSEIAAARERSLRGQTNNRAMAFQPPQRNLDPVKPTLSGEGSAAAFQQPSNSGPVKERTLVASTLTEPSNQVVHEEAAPPVVEAIANPASEESHTSDTSALNSVPSDASDCTGAKSEAEKAGEKTEPADKLFHIRRALRMCPDDPAYHVQLGELYKTLNRTDDAMFEYKEALRIDSSNSDAKRSLAALKGTTTTAKNNGKY